MRIAITYLFLLITWHASGQQETLVLTTDQAVDLALSNHPVLSKGVPVQSHRFFFMNWFGSKRRQTEALRAEADYLQQERAYSAKVKSAYFTLIYAHSRFLLLQKLQPVFSDIPRIASLQYDKGALDLSESLAITTDAAEINTMLDMAVDAHTIALNSLKDLLFTDLEIVPAVRELSMYMIPEPAEAPEEIDRTRENLILQMDMVFKRILYFDQYALLNADIIERTASLKLEKEEIEYFEYASEVSRVLAIKLDYLQTLDQYNQLAIQLESYAK